MPARSTFALSMLTLHFIQFFVKRSAIQPTKVRNPIHPNTAAIPLILASLKSFELQAGLLV
jgi:hypothetical protein